MSRSDLVLLGQAIKGRWPMSPEMRERVIARLELVAMRSDSPREIISASKALLSADRLNLEQERRDLSLPSKIVEHTGTVQVEHTHEQILEDLEPYNEVLRELLEEFEQGGGEVPADDHAEPVGKAEASPGPGEATISP